MPWKNQDNFYYKNMIFNKSCFPCSMQMILSNMGKYKRSDKIEKQWDVLQLENNGVSLDDDAPNEKQIHRNIRQTDLRGASVRVITPSMLAPGTNQQQLNEEVNDFFPQYTGMIIGIGHAHIIYRIKDYYMYVSPLTNLNQTVVERYDKIVLESVEGEDGSFAIRVKGGKGNHNLELLLAGNFMMLFK